MAPHFGQGPDKLSLGLVFITFSKKTPEGNIAPHVSQNVGKKGILDSS